MTLLTGTEAFCGSEAEALRAAPAPWEVAGSPRTPTSQEALQKPRTMFKHQIQPSRHPVYHPYHLLAGGGVDGTMTNTLAASSSGNWPHSFSNWELGGSMEDGFTEPGS